MPVSLDALLDDLLAETARRRGHGSPRSTTTASPSRPPAVGWGHSRPGHAPGLLRRKAATRAARRPRGPSGEAAAAPHGRRHGLPRTVSAGAVQGPGCGRGPARGSSGARTAFAAAFRGRDPARPACPGTGRDHEAVASSVTGADHGGPWAHGQDIADNPRRGRACRPIGSGTSPTSAVSTTAFQLRGCTNRPAPVVPRSGSSCARPSGDRWTWGDGGRRGPRRRHPRSTSA